MFLMRQMKISGQRRPSRFDGNLANKHLALVALKMENANNLNLYLGEFSIVRGTFEKPEMPQVVSTALLHSAQNGVDGKIIFNMPNDKGPGEPCYNTRCEDFSFSNSGHSRVMKSQS